MKKVKIPYLLVGVARSGTTSLARVLDHASNGCCVVEPVPNLNIETRLAMDGRSFDFQASLRDGVVNRLQNHLGDEGGQIYGEKDVSYAPFIELISRELPTRFVYIHRDGRDVVRSLVNWHDCKFGTVYRECADPGDLNSAAISSAANLPVHLDTSDYSRPRPARGSALNIEWPTLSRAEMCAYYWASVNDLYLEQLTKIPRDSWIAINYTDPSVEAVLQVAEFLELKGITADIVAPMLERRINSLSERGESDSGRYPRWPDWDGGMRRKFDRLAGRTMNSLGYYGPNPSTRWKPRNYGAFWMRRTSDENWYEWMFDGRRRAHDDMIAWVFSLDNAGDQIASVMDIGCGRGIGYSEIFRSKRYVGVDISEPNILWCQKNRYNKNHQYISIDFVEKELIEKVDLVFSSGTIDNCYDVDAYLAAMVRNAKKWIYLTCYRGWHPGISEHVYRYNADHGCFYNDISVPRLLERLENLGCIDISVTPIRVASGDIPFETRVTARVTQR